MKPLLFLFCFYASILGAAQITTNSEWTWMKGDSTFNQPGIYGIKEIAAPTNKPGARYHSISWTDLSGNLWLFGGNGFGANSGNAYLNDLWKYNVSEKQWTWVKGDSTAFNILNDYGVYGMQGVTAPTNKPGSRAYSVSWTDHLGNLWLFGGYGGAAVIATYGPLNDLWKYNPSTNQWTWVNGDSISAKYGVYGIKGIASTANKPGGRSQSILWVDLSGNVWLFGGYGLATNNSTLEFLSDLWKYDISTNQWTWISGDNVHNQSGVYGTRGVPSPTNKPGARRESVSWRDHSGNVWLFGGEGRDGLGNQGRLNDLWKYDPVNNLWTWVNGDNVVNGPAIYGTLGVGALNNKPGARQGSVAWKDSLDNLWLFGGYKYEPTAKYFNDLWRYDISNNRWTWVKGDSVVEVNGVYGSQGVSAATNKPGGRGNSISWLDQYENLWLFGGNNGAFLNDLWKLSNVPVTTIPPTFENIIVYPTLTNGRITIKLPPGMENVSIRVLNITGQEMIIDNGTTLNRAINLSPFANSVYLVQVGNKSKILKTTKVMLIR